MIPRIGHSGKGKAADTGRNQQFRGGALRRVTQRCMILRWRVHVPHLGKPRGRTTPRQSPDVTCGLCMTMTCDCRSPTGGHAESGSCARAGEGSVGFSAPSTLRCLSVLRTGKTRRHVCVPVATSARTLTPAGRAQPGDTRPPSRPLQEEPGQNCLPLKPFLMRPSIDLGDGSLRRVGKGHCWHTCDTTRSQGTHRGLRPQGSWGGQTPGRPGGTAIPHRPSPFPDSGSACSSSTGQHQSQVPPRAFVMVAFKQRNKNAVTLGFRGARQRAVAMGTAHRALDARLLPGTTMVLLPPPPTHKLLPHPLLDPRDKEEKPQHVSSLKRDTAGWWAKGDKEINSLGATGLHAATPGARHPHSGAPLPGMGPQTSPAPTLNAGVESMFLYLFAFWGFISPF